MRCLVRMSKEDYPSRTVLLFYMCVKKICDFKMETNFRVFISANYKQAKLMIQRNCWKCGMRFDDDVFEDVIMKCLEKAPIMNNYNGYLIASYNHAYWNECKRYCNSHRSDEKIPEQQYNDNIDDIIDLNIIYDNIAASYDDDIMLLFKK